MKLIDTHAHLQFEAFDPDRTEVIKNNVEVLEAVMTVGASLDSSKKAVSLAEANPNLYSSIGVHPHHVDQWNSQTLQEFEQLIKSPKVVAVGEIGLDKHFYQGYPEPNIKEQTEILLPQISLANKHNKPILFHCRDAYQDLLALMQSLDKPINGLMHCFMGEAGLAKKFLDFGLFISFSGNITYKGNDYIRDAASYVPLDRILVETDSPYLTPEPHRGQRNEPKYVKIVTETISSLKKLSLETVEQATVTNSKKLLNLK